MDIHSTTLASLPTRRGAALFGIKAALLQLRRAIVNAGDPALRRWPRSPAAGLVHCRGESVTALDASGGSEQRALVLGKIENLRVALRSIDGVQVPAGGTFSFWTQLGRALSWRGYVEGRELREGCIIPAIGGGLCQLSNGLYQAALDAGLTIIERHAHSQVVPGSAAQRKLDATVFWNYIDLRFSAPVPFRIAADLDGGQLRVRIFMQAAPPVVAASTPIALARADAASPRSCHSCGEQACFRRAQPAPDAALRRTAFMVDTWWPEFDAWICGVKGAADTLMLPLDGSARGKPQYGWRTGGFAKVVTFDLLTLWRALASRRLASQGAARQRSAMAFRRRLAQRYVKALGYLDEHVVVTQELLPYVWQSGALQGRSFDVLMTAPPMLQLQAVLDAAHQRHPDSATLADFRAPQGLAQLEQLALAGARRILTPHAALAAQFDTAVLLPWTQQPAATARPGRRIVFPASTLGRKGAYELRAAARELDLSLTLMGPVIESPSFWDGVDVSVLPFDAQFDDVAVVVLPAWSENRPARLIRALECGVNVIATPACGLPPQAGLTLVPVGDVKALTDALRLYSRGNALQ